MALQISGASFVLQYRRTTSKSIDSTDVWTTLADAQTYAANADDVKYVPIDGQIISVTENNKTYRLVPDESISTEDGKKHYKLQEIATTDQLDNYLSKDLFSSVFGLIDVDGNELDLHDDGVIDLTRSIQAKFGLWTNEFLSAKGLNPAEGEMSITLKSLNDVEVSDIQAGESLVWNGSYWVNQLIEGGGIDEEALREYLNQNNYATTSDITTALSSYATISLVNTKLDSSTFLSTVERIDGSLEDIYADLETKATKDELSAVSSDLEEFKTETNTNINNLQSDISELDSKKLNVDYFQALFGLIDGSDTEVTPNTEIPETIKGIKAKFGLWTEEYLSALGMNPANGEVSLTLASLNDVQFSELTEGQSIVWNGTKWINQLIESGGLDESQLEDYLSRNSYATTQDITDAMSSKVDTATFNSTISDLNTSISDLETELETKASKDELSTAVSTINTRIDGVVTDVNAELATKATKTELTEAVTTLEQSISDVDDDLQTFKTTTEENLATKLDIAFFSKVFGLIGEDGSEITVNNDTSVTIESIQAKFGLWTEQFLSAKGLNPSDGSVTGISLKDLAGVNINSPQNGEGLVYQDGYWVNQVVQTGEDGNPFYVWQGESADAPTLSNSPAVEWTTTELKNEHVDDYYVTTEGLVYQFTSEHIWKLVTDKYLIDCWNKLDQFDDDLTERVEALEAGSATNIQSAGEGNVVTDVTKSGTVITVNKDISVYTKSEIDTKTNNIDQSINSVSSAVSTEVERAKSAEATLTTNLNAEVTRAKEAESTLTTNLNNEISRAKAAEQAIADDLLALVNKLNQMFTLEGDGSTGNPYRIKANYGLYTDQFLSALGYNSGTSGGVGGESLSDSLVWHASAYWYNADDAGANGAALITAANNSKNFCTFDFVSNAVGTYKIDISSGYYVRPMSSTQSHPDSYTQVQRGSSAYTNGAQLTSETILNSLGGTHWALNIGKGSGFSQEITLEEAKAAVTFTKL